MHEVGLCEGIVAAVEQRAAGRPVSRVRVRAGVLLRIVEPSLRQAFAMVTEGTVAEHATIELTEVPARLHCHGCGYHGDTGDPLATCPACRGGDVQLTGGDELLLESIALRDPAPDSATASG